MIQNVLRFWLDRGVDGFRIDAIPHLFEVEDLSMEVRPGDVRTFIILSFGADRSEQTV